MVTALNNFFIVELVDELNNSIETNSKFIRYFTSVDLKIYSNCGNTNLLIGRIKSADKYCFPKKNEYAYNSDCTYIAGDLILFNNTKIIHTFDDGTVLLRDDAIYALYDSSINAPIAGEHQVVLKQDVSNLSYADIEQYGFIGTVCDIDYSITNDYESSVFDKQELTNIEVGNSVVLVKPSSLTTNNEAFCILSNADTFYIIANVKSIACLLSKENLTNKE